MLYLAHMPTCWRREGKQLFAQKIYSVSEITDQISENESHDLVSPRMEGRGGDVDA
jgi:hypothetical protein